MRHLAQSFLGTGKLHHNVGVVRHLAPELIQMLRCLGIVPRFDQAHRQQHAGVAPLGIEFNDAPVIGHRLLQAPHFSVDLGTQKEGLDVVRLALEPALSQEVRFFGSVETRIALDERFPDQRGQGRLAIHLLPQEFFDLAVKRAAGGPQ